MQISDNIRNIFGLFSSFQNKLFITLSLFKIKLAYYASPLDFSLLYVDSLAGKIWPNREIENSFIM